MKNDVSKSHGSYEAPIPLCFVSTTVGQELEHVYCWAQPIAEGEHVAKKIFTLLLTESILLPQ